MKASKLDMMIDEVKEYGAIIGSNFKVALFWTFITNEKSNL